MEEKLIGYIAGIKYNSEGTLTPWEYGKKSLVGYGESPHMFKTESGAKRHLDKLAPHMGIGYVRPYYEQIS